MGAGPAQQSPDISLIIQEIVDRPGWTSGNALVLIFEPNSGDNSRPAWTFDGSAADAAVLNVEYVLFPDLLVMKATFTLEDPVNGTTDPKAIPGASSQIRLYSSPSTGRAFSAASNGSSGAASRARIGRPRYSS